METQLKQREASIKEKEQATRKQETCIADLQKQLAKRDKDKKANSPTIPQSPYSVLDTF